MVESCFFFSLHHYFLTHDLVVFTTLEVWPDYSLVHKCRAVVCPCIAVTAEEQKHRLNKYSLN